MHNPLCFTNLFLCTLPCARVNSMSPIFHHTSRNTSQPRPAQISSPWTLPKNHHHHLPRPPSTSVVFKTLTLTNMEDYPEEIRTPPVTLVSIVGHQDLHATISTHLHSEQPPINTLALPDFSKISVIAKTPKEKENQLPSSFTSSGILKRDWLSKHRTRVPAVVAALFDSDQLSGDPALWQQVCTDIENLKYAILHFHSLSVC